MRDLGLDCEWERTGALSVAVEDHQVEWLRDSPAHPDQHFLDREQVRAAIDSPLFLAGGLAPDTTALVHPARLALGLARAAADLGVEIHEHSAVTAIRREGDVVEVATDRATVTSDHVVLATDVFPALLRRNRLMTVPVYDYVLVTEPLTAEQLASIGWAGRQGLGDLANQFHYARLTADDRVLWGGYDAVYPAGGRLHPRHEDRPESHARLASHFLATFPQLEGVRFTHRWAGAIDTSTQFAAFYGTHARRPGRPCRRLHRARRRRDPLGGRGAARPPRRSADRAHRSCGWCASARSPSRRSRSPRPASTSPAGRSTAPTTARGGATASCACSTGPGWGSTPEHRVPCTPAMAPGSDQRALPRATGTAVLLSRLHMDADPRGRRRRAILPSCRSSRRSTTTSPRCPLSGGRWWRRSNGRVLPGWCPEPIA